MSRLYFLFGFLLALSSCESTGSSGGGSELRINSTDFGLGMTHNSHLGRPFSTLESAYSATANFQVFLGEVTNHEDIFLFQIVDENGEGWQFSNAEILEAYNSDNHSLIFYDLELRNFDNINGILLESQILDENEEVVFTRGFSMDNNFPLPATGFFESNGSILLDFYNTPYDGGSIPFNVTIYNTMYSSNTFILRWMSESNQVLGEEYYDFNSFTESANGSNDWAISVNGENIPSGASSFYFTILRGWFTTGGILYTNIEDIPEEFRQ